MEDQLKNMAPYAQAAVKLLQGPVFEDQIEIWEELNQYKIELKGYFDKIGLELVIDKRDGYSYLKQIELDESGRTIGLVRRMPLTYNLTIVCVLLREWLSEFESGEWETANLYITPKEFRDRIEMFFKENANQVKFIKELNKYFEQCVEMGFLKLVHSDPSDPDNNRFEVRRIIKARITNEELTRFKNQLENDLKASNQVPPTES